MFADALAASEGIALAVDAAAAGARLDLHEGIGDPLPPGTACCRWPEHQRLRNLITGEVIRGRCKATNLCDYCARLMAVETSELLMLDAMEDAPQLYVVLTARELLERTDCRDHLRQLRKSLRKRWPNVRWACLVEFQRRGALHLNLLVKGVPAEDARELYERTATLWCSRVDAEPQAQFVGEVSDGGGLVRYIALHFLKPAQAPPIGWRGHRISYSRDYLVRPAGQLREEAKSSLRLKRELWRAHQLGHEGEDAERVAGDAIARNRAIAGAWKLWEISPRRIERFRLDAGVNGPPAGTGGECTTSEDSERGLPLAR